MPLAMTDLLCQNLKKKLEKEWGRMPFLWQHSLFKTASLAVPVDLLHKSDKTVVVRVLSGLNTFSFFRASWFSCRGDSFGVGFGVNSTLYVDRHGQSLKEE